MVGALILSALIILVIGIIAVSLLSEGPSGIVPAVRIDLRNESETLVLVHMGGDILSSESTIVVVDGVDRTLDFQKNDVTWSNFSVGDRLTLVDAFSPDVSVQIIHTAPDAPTLLYTIGGESAPTPIPTPSPTPTVTPTPTPTPTEHSINPLNVPDRPGVYQSPGYLQFRVNGLYSYIEIDGVQYDLAIGDTVRLTINSDDSAATIYCSGWMLTTFSYSDVTLSINGASVTTGAVTQVYISQSDSYISTLDLTVPQVDPPVWTRLNVDGVDIINGEDGREIVLYGMRPDATGLMNIDRAGNYFVCRAAYTIGGVTPTPTPTPSPDPITADFSGTPLSGEIPLTVQFTDLSTGSPTSWFWDFGDGSGLFVQNPEHTYTTTGTFTVSLTASKTGSTDTETKVGYINVIPAGIHTIYLNSDKEGDLLQNGYFQFRVTGSWSSIRVGGPTTNLAVGDTVRLTINTGTQGDIYTSTTSISSFSFDDVSFTLNGVYQGRGKINSIWISGYDSVESTLTLRTNSANEWTNMVVDGDQIINGNYPDIITLYNLQPKIGGGMNLNNEKKQVYYDGGASSYDLT